MICNPHQHHRRSIRLTGYDYTQPGAYFVTVCSHNHECLFDSPVLRRVAETNWQAIRRYGSHIVLDAWVLMPNHLHGILIIQGPALSVGARHSLHTLTPVPDHASGARDAPASEPSGSVSPPHGAPAGSLGVIVGTFKAVTARRINSIRHTPGAVVWQRNYYEHIIRTEKALQRIREYISNNPLVWDLDIENPANAQRRQGMGTTAYYSAVWDKE